MDQAVAQPRENQNVFVASNDPAPVFAEDILMASIEKQNHTTGSQPKPPRIPAWRKWLLAGIGLLAALGLGLAIIVQTSFFRPLGRNPLGAASAGGIAMGSPLGLAT